MTHSPQETAIWRFASRYPNVAITLDSSDAPTNLVAAGFDLAIRLGNLPDSALRSRRIGTFERCLVAAPAYVAGIKPLVVPSDLSRCHFVVLSTHPEKFVLQRADEAVTVQPERSRVLVNSVAAARSAILAGLGVQRLPLSEVQQDLDRGHLVRLLPDWSLPTLNIHAVWPASSDRSRLVRMLLDDLLNA